MTGASFCQVNRFRACWSATWRRTVPSTPSNRDELAVAKGVGRAHDGDHGGNTVLARDEAERSEILAGISAPKGFRLRLVVEQGGPFELNSSDPARRHA